MDADRPRGARRCATTSQKGGFLIVDDFKTPGWRGIPRRRLGAVRGEHAARAARACGSSTWTRRTRSSTRSSRSTRSTTFPQAYNAGQPIFRGVFEDNDPTQAAADDRQLQHRHLAVLGVVGPRPPAVRRDQRSLQARRQLHHLRPDSLKWHLDTCYPERCHLFSFEGIFRRRVFWRTLLRSSMARFEMTPDRPFSASLPVEERVTAFLRVGLRLDVRRARDHRGHAPRSIAVLAGPRHRRSPPTGCCSGA